MKKLVLFLFAGFVSTLSFAQAPQAFAFQSTITDTLGVPISDKEVTVQFTIHTGSDDGPSVYIENHLVTTSANGYFTANVGQGDVDFGVFADISWGTSSYWLELAVDTTGGVDYVSLGASQLLSVPYALNAGGSEPSVYFTGSFNFDFGDDVVYDEVTPVLFETEINRGFTYDPLTGEFTITSSGIYEITGKINIPFIEGEVLMVNYVVNDISVEIYGPIDLTVELEIGDTFSIEAEGLEGKNWIKIKEIK